MVRVVDLATLRAPKTAEERREAVAALEQARQVREELLAARGGRLFPSAGKDLDQLRTQRTRELP